MRMKLIQTFLSFLFFLGLSAPASANTGLPMIFVTFPGMIVALLPIILVESYVLSRQLAIPGRMAIKASSIANVATTVVGIPLTWLALVVIQLATGGDQAYGLDSYLHKFLAVTWQAPWLIPYESDMYWMVPAATLTLLVPFFFVSWWIEYQVVRRTVVSSHPSGLSFAVRNANLASYGLLALVVTLKLLFFRQTVFLI